MPLPTVTKLFRNPVALSSALAALGTLHSRALRFLNSLVTLVLASNYCVEIDPNNNGIHFLHHKTHLTITNLTKEKAAEMH